MKRLLTLSTLAIALAAAALRGQTVRWDPPGGFLPFGKTSQIELVFENCTPSDKIAIPPVEGLTIQSAGQSTNFTLFNGVGTQSVRDAYAVLLSEQKAVQIPSFSVDTNKGPLQVPAVRFQPTGATVGSTGVSVDDVAEARLTASRQSVWAGEIFGLNYSIEADKAFFPDFNNGVPDWDGAPLVAEDWGQPRRTSGNHAGEPRMGVQLDTRAFARAPGRLALHAPHQLLNLAVSTGGLGFFQQREVQQFQITGSAPVIEVRPLPPAPDGYEGAVGSFKLTSHIVPTQVSVGEPVTWTIELSGTGNWPDIEGLPAREVSKAFQVIQPKPHRTPVPGKRFEATLSEDVVLMPTQAGSYALPPVKMIVFNPGRGDYDVLTAPGDTVAVQAPPAPPAASGPGSGDITAGSAAGAAAAAAPQAARAPAPLPRDPLAAREDAPLPLPEDRLLAWSALGALLPALLTWLGLARALSRKRDPLESRRRARRRLAAVLDRMGRASPAGMPPLLHEWRSQAGILLGFGGLAVPGARAPNGPWAELWAEADRALFGRDPALSDTWLPRARAALAGTRVAPLNWALVLSAGALFPTLLLLLLAPPLRMRAAGAAPTPAAAYRSGNFAAAEAGWRAELETAPARWSAHYDLALALAQQSRWNEAAAQAAAAFVQNPRDPATRATFELTCSQSGSVPDALAPFLLGGVGARAASLASPAQWQRATLAGALALAAGLVVLLLGAYGVFAVRAARPAGLTLMAAAALAIGGSLAGRHAYGPAGDARAAIAWRAGTLRSVPTDADVSQQTVPLDAGSLGLVDRRFLGWVHLTFPDGQGGWLRREEVVAIWR